MPGRKIYAKPTNQLYSLAVKFNVEGGDRQQWKNRTVWSESNSWYQLSQQSDSRRSAQTKWGLRNTVQSKDTVGISINDSVLRGRENAWSTRYLYTAASVSATRKLAQLGQLEISHVTVESLQASFMIAATAQNASGHACWLLNSSKVTLFWFWSCWKIPEEKVVLETQIDE